MNNKGQSLILFVVIIPLIFILGVFVFDLSNTYSEKSRLDGIAYDALYNMITYDQPMTKAKAYIYSNDSKIKIDKFNEDSICLSKDTEPILGGVIGRDKFTIKSCYHASVHNSILRIEEEGD